MILVYGASMRYPEDRELTKRVNDRDQAAFLTLYDRFSAAIYRHALLRVGSREVAEDVVSRTFTKAWEYLRDPNHAIQNSKAFLFRIAHNHIVDHWREQERAPLAMEDFELEHHEISAPTHIGEDVDRSIDVAWLQKKLAELPEDERRLLLWRYVDELSIAEIAKLAKKSMGATYVAIHRAKRMLERIALDSRPHERQ